MTVGFEADIDNAMGTRREQRNSEAKKGYIETAINYVSGLSTRAKTGLAAVGVVAVLGLGANYVLNRESPSALVNGRSLEAYNKEIEKEFPIASRKERLEKQRAENPQPWMFE